MAAIWNFETEEVLTTDGEIPPIMTYGIDIYDEETDELVVEDRIEVDGEEYRVLDDGVE